MKSLRCRLSDLARGRYSTMLVVCGSNDLCRCDRTPQRVVYDLIARFLIDDCDVKTVVVSQIVRRSKANAKYFEISLEEYNSRVNMINDLLDASCHNPSHFWKHDRRVCHRVALCKDGVHFNGYGLRQFHRSIRRALSKYMLS